MNYCGDKLMLFFSEEELRLVLNSLSEWDGLTEETRNKRLSEKEKDNLDGILRAKGYLISEIRGALQDKTLRNLVKIY